MRRRLAAKKTKADGTPIRLVLIGFLTLQLLVQAWSINFPAANQILAGELPSAARMTIAQLDVDDDHRSFKGSAPLSLALTIQPVGSISEEHCTETSAPVPPSSHRPIYQQISVLLI